MKTKKQTFIIIALPLLIVVLIFVAVFISKYDKDITNNSSLISYPSSISSTPAPYLPQVHIASTSETDVINCSPYVSSKYGFEFTCPPDWRIVDETSDEAFSPILLRVALAAKDKEGVGFDGQFFVVVFDKLQLQSIDDVGLSGKQFSDRVTKTENINLNGTSAEKVIITSPANPGWILKKIIFEKGDQIYLVHNGAVDNSLFEEFSMSFKLL